MVLDFEGLDVAGPALALALHVMAQLGVGHLLRLLGGDEELIGDDRHGDVLARPAFQFFAHTDEIALDIGLQMPVLEGIVVDALGGGTLDEGLAFEFLDGAAVAHVTLPPEGLDIEDGAGFDGHLDVLGVIGGEMLDVLVGKGQHVLTALGDDPAA